jgi:N-glycosylase/DNA lyase
MLDELQQKYQQKKSLIGQRLDEFRSAYRLPDSEIFAELCFCLLTPQTKAKSAALVIDRLKERGLLLTGTAEEIKKWMAPIRFNQNKSRYIIEARQMFADSNGKIKLKEKLEAQPDVFAIREWLIANVKGFGMKEASHFLRNIGMGDDIAILDRHILKNLVRYKVIEEVPKSLTDKKYLEIEDKMRKFAASIGIPFAHLDLLWWSEETGEIFK